jgi:hypothetical protein
LRKANTILVAKPEGRKHFGDIGIVENTLKWILRKQSVKLLIGLCGSAWAHVSGSC